ncbi:MAG: UDP-N-acetylmuramate dehydrogenase [Pseudomonadota bacterium]|nr:UDP-N-acetylmuramate dehydrogenase [Pseudomonadota bacterium]
MRSTPHLIKRLPAVRGELIANASLQRLTWFRTGGKAEVLFKPADTEDLQTFRRELDPQINVTVIGLGSNILIRDGGVKGVVIVLGKGFGKITFNNTEVIAQAGVSSVTLSRACREKSLGGLEFLSGIPGSIGGALRMNAGAYGREIKDVLISAQALDPAGLLRDLPMKDFGFSYRSSALNQKWVFVSARLSCTIVQRDEIERRMVKIENHRRSTQPIQVRTGGSTFKNLEKIKAWKLIASAGCRGLSVGDAIVSERHCNFLINRGNASAGDIENLGEKVRDRVKRHTGVSLEWEIERIGIKAREIRH